MVFIYNSKREFWNSFTREFQKKPFVIRTATKTGKTILYADKYFASSQLCSDCGFKNAGMKDIGIREWVCPKCGAKHDRDRNAALNLQKVGASALTYVTLIWVSVSILLYV